MNAFNTAEIKEVICQISAQLGKTEIVLNVIGYFIDFDGSPILVVQPTDELAEAFSKDRLATMIRDTPSLRRKVASPKSRNSGNTMFHKTFPGGHVTIVTAKSPAALRGRPVRIILQDEYSAYTVTSEGDPGDLADRRANNFWNRKLGKFSTPGIKGLCRIEAAMDRSDKRRFFIPCPRCEHPHVLKFGNVVWPEGQPLAARFKCPDCEGEFSNAEKNLAVRKCGPLEDGTLPIGIDGLPLGWRATAPFNGVAGFYLWEAYSPWRSIGEIAEEFLKVKDDPSRLHVFVNTVLGETWEEGGDAVNEHDLVGRCEAWPKDADVPERGLVLTAGVDVQPDRLEVETVAWAGGEESWSVHYHVIHGDPETPEGMKGSPWNDLTDYIRRGWKHERWGEVTIETTCVDSGGSNTQAVYEYVKRHRGDRVFAIKGKGGPGIPIIGNPARRRSGKKTKRPVDVYTVGVDQAKSIIYKRLRITAPGPGYCHFPEGRTTDYFRQLTAERGVTRWVKGFPRIEWVKRSDARNEALDCRVYAFAALVLRAPAFDKVAYKLKQRREAVRVPAQKNEDDEAEKLAVIVPKEEPKPKRRLRSRRRGGFVSGWR